MLSTFDTCIRSFDVWDLGKGAHGMIVRETLRIGA